MREDPNKKIIIAVFATILVVSALFWAVIFQLGGKVKASFENYQKEKLNSLVLEEKRDKVLKLKRELPDLEKKKNSLNAMLMKKDAAVPFLRSLEKIAGEASCQIKIEPADINKIKFTKKAASAAPKKEDDELDTDKNKDETKLDGEKEKKEDSLAPLKSYPAFSIEVAGRFSGMVDFFQKLENMPYFVQPLVVDISSEVKKTAAAGSVGTLSAGTAAVSEVENQEEKNIKMTMTFVVYGD